MQQHKQRIVTLILEFQASRTDRPLGAILQHRVVEELVDHIMAAVLYAEDLQSKPSNMKRETTCQQSSTAGKCNRLMKCNRNGIAVLSCQIDEDFVQGEEGPSFVKTETEHHIRMADEYICPNCQGTMLNVNATPAFFPREPEFEIFKAGKKNENKLVKVYT
jgi:acetone carboxylase gamma subunit